MDVTPTETTVAPLIITLRMDHDAQARFTALRREHFPPERNFLNAHITLFHKLPGAELDAILAGAAQVAKTTRPFALRTDGMMFFGSGVAYRLASPEAVRLREELVARWADLLAPQDQKKDFTPHITIQNKVKSDIAKQLYARLSGGFRPETLHAVGLEIWHYRGGPWEPAGRFNFPAA